MSEQRTLEQYKQLVEEQSSSLLKSLHEITSSQWGGPDESSIRELSHSVADALHLLQKQLGIEEAHLHNVLDQTIDKEPLFLEPHTKESAPDASSLLAMKSAVEHRRLITHENEGKKALAVPLRFADEIIGVLGFAVDSEQLLEPDDLAAVEAIVEQVGLALENQRLFDQTQEALAETLATQRRFVRQEWSAYTQSDDWQKQEDTIEQSQSQVHTAVTLKAVEQEKTLLEVHGNETIISLPVSYGGEMIGAMAFSQDEAIAWDENDVTAVSAIVEQVGLALENQRLFDQTQARAEELAVINRVAQAVSQKIEEPVLLLEAVYEQIQRVLPAEMFMVGIYSSLTAQIEYPLIYEKGQRRQQSPQPITNGSRIAQVVQTGEPLLINRTLEEVVNASQQQSDEFANNRTFTPASLLYIPLQIGLQVVGTLALQSTQFNAYSPSSVALLTGISNHVAVALENARLFAETQTALAETEALYQASARLNEAQSYNDILTVIRQYTQIGQRAQNMVLGYFNQAWREELPEWMTVLGYWDRLGIEMGLPLRYRMAELPFVSLLRMDSPLFIENINTDPRLTDESRESLANGKFESVTFAPLVAAGQWIGYLSIFFQTPTRFTETEIRRFTALTGQAAVAAQNIHLLEETASKARREQLLREITAQVRSSSDIDTIMRTAVREIGQALGRPTFVYLDKPED